MHLAQSSFTLAEEERQQWADACLAAKLGAMLWRQNRPVGFVVRAQAGPVRNEWVDQLHAELGRSVEYFKMPNSIEPDRLLGGLDLAATLNTGKPVLQAGLLSEANGGVLIVPMAETLEPAIASTLADVIESGSVRVERDGLSCIQKTRFLPVIFDESNEGDEGVDAALLDRLTIHIDLEGVSVRAVSPRSGKERRLFSVPGREVPISDSLCEQISQTALSFGLSSMRPAMQTIAVARAHAQVGSRDEVSLEDAVVAVRLCLLGRARCLPSAQEEPVTEETPEPVPPDPKETSQDDMDSDFEQSAQKPPEDMVLDALAASLPKNLLEQLKQQRDFKLAKPASGRRSANAKAAKRGRMLTSRRGQMRHGKRLDVLATLRAAAPWQRVRNAHAVRTGRLQVRSSDFHIRRFRDKTGSTVLFVVDASGSTALNRLGEAKGAIELLLGESYSRRDHVGLVSFRGRDAEILLPPTRALARAKRNLSALPGGGGTPLASGLQSALLIALDERKRGRQPSIVLLTDGSANVDLDGVGGRVKAMDDAKAIAQEIAANSVPAVLVDLGRKPKPAVHDLCAAMNASYVAMPYAGAESLSSAVRAEVG